MLYLLGFILYVCYLLNTAHDWADFIVNFIIKSLWLILLIYALGNNI